MRKPLQKLLLSAWEKAIATDYCNQRINSERSLQASVWAQLNTVLNPTTRRMFVEPRFDLKVNGKTISRYPDIVICNSVHVIAVIELKYLPRGVPKYEKDLETLALLAKQRSELSVSNIRFRGESRDAKDYAFSDSVLFVWAGIHRTPVTSFQSPEALMLSTGVRELEGCFLQLHAETNLDKKPNIFSRFG